MKEDLLYRLWLNACCGHDPGKIDICIKHFGTAEEIYKRNDFPNIKGLGLSAKNLKDKSQDAAKNIIDDCERKSIRIISIDSEEYPKRLRHTSYPPQILYVKGKMPEFDELVCISVVGTRKATAESKTFVRELTADLARSGVLIVSGMAMGTDTAAHLGALTGGGMTVGVLAGGVDVIYPKGNKDIYDAICECGAIISEQPPGTVGRPEFYRDRNRIMAGLSSGILVGEANMRTGVIHTVNAAFEENRDVFAIPVSPYNSLSQYPNYLLQNGAKLVRTAEDVLDEYVNVYVEELEKGLKIRDEIIRDYPDLKNIRSNAYISDDKINKTSTDDTPKPDIKDYEGFEGNERIVLEYLLRCGGTAHIDVISAECGIAMPVLSSTLLLLQMRGVVKQKAGNHFCLKGD